MKNTRFFTLAALLLAVSAAWAAIPSGYYNAARGKKGQALKTALFQIISSHTNVGYNNLPDVYAVADIRPDGKVYDMYSNTTNYTLSDLNRGNASEGAGLNKEHSFPKSWFGGKVNPMYADAFHVIPTDAYINNMRSNLPFGETKSPTKTSHNAFSKVGPSSVSGYTGTVFEPNDIYKGDFARIYFYMATAYEDKIANWDCPMLAGNKYPAYTSWAVSMLLRWAKNDPVSDKETQRNNAVYSKQHNRNPFVDFPGLEEYIWGDKQNVSFDPDNFGGTDTPDVGAPAAPTFSPEGGTVEAGTVVTISSATPGANICYIVNGGEELRDASPLSLTLTETTTIAARAELSGHYSAFVSADFTVPVTVEPGDGTLFTRVTSTAELQAGRRYLIVCESESCALAAQSNDIRSYAEVSIEGAQISTETGTSSTPYALTLGGTTGAWTLYDAVSDVYLALTSNGNKLHTATSGSTNGAQWSISISSGSATITPNAYDNRHIQYNKSAPRFACYTGGQQAVSLYVQAPTDGLPSAIGLDRNARVDVCTVDGRLLRRGVAARTALQGLPRGIYVVGTRRVLVR